MNNEKMAQMLVDGLEWLSNYGRDAARALDASMVDKTILDEAVPWLEDLRDGKAID